MNKKIDMDESAILIYRSSVVIIGHKVTIKWAQYKGNKIFFTFIVERE